MSGYTMEHNGRLYHVENGEIVPIEDYRCNQIAKEGEEIIAQMFEKYGSAKQAQPAAHERHWDDGNQVTNRKHANQPVIVGEIPDKASDWSYWIIGGIILVALLVRWW